MPGKVVSSGAKRVLLCGSILLTAASQQATANWWSGNDLDDACRDSNNAAAIGFVFGVIDGIEVGNQTGAKVYYCIPDDVVGKHLLDVVCRYVVGHPAERQVPASYLAIVALQEAWPCKG